MDYNQLKTIINEGLSGTTFNLSAEQLGTSEISQLFKNFLSVERLTFDQATVNTVDGESKIIITGKITTTIFSAQSLDVIAELFITQDKPEISIKLSK
ncbi:hypothetical protein U2I54_28960, partial [Bacillus pseudomycoides]|nr:hypothetical protein [Bacillus pseudomycoides]